MYKYLIILYLAFFVTQNIYTQMNYNLSKWNLSMEVHRVRITSDIFEPKNTSQIQLGLDYQLCQNWRLGIFVALLAYPNNPDLALIEQKSIRMQSLLYQSGGLSIGYLHRKGKIFVQPKCDIGYNILNIEAADFEQNRNQFLDYRYLSATPKLQLGLNLYKLVIGITGGYQHHLTALKGDILKEFNPNSYQLGVFVSMNIP
jgi:hypothetical protein